MRQAALLLVIWIIVVSGLFPDDALVLSGVGAGWIGLYLLEFKKINFITHVIALSLPILLTFHFYQAHLHAWWLADDPALLQAIAAQGIFPHFYVSDVWRQVSPANLTPWLLASLGIDWQLFQLAPFGYYLHHFLAFSLVLSVSYWLLIRYFSPLIASFVLSWFVLSTPVAHLLQFLMVRHYLEGLGFAVAALLFYLKALRYDNRQWSLLGSGCYLLAVTAKEIYVPLIILLPLFPEARWRQRINHLIPFIFIAIGYVLWRAEMLQWQRLVSGYDSSVIPKLTWDYILHLPQHLMRILEWVTPWQRIIFSATLLLFWSVLLRQARISQILQVFLWIAAVSVPIIPVLTILDTRYLVLPYFLLCIGFGWSLQYLKPRYPVAAIILGFCLVIASVQTVYHLSFNQLQQRYRAEGHFILRGESGTLMQPIGMYWYYQGLQWLRIHTLQLPDSTSVCYDPCVCAMTPPIYHYDAHQLRLDKYTESQATCGLKMQSLQSQVRLENDILFWQLVAHPTGQYYASLSKNNQLHGQFFPIPATGQFAVVAEKVYLVFKYVAATGETQYSPNLEVTTPPKTRHLMSVE
jgi:hypothetical protein